MKGLRKPVFCFTATSPRSDIESIEKQTDPWVGMITYKHERERR
jgi:hypothetical protein